MNFENCFRLIIISDDGEFHYMDAHTVPRIGEDVTVVGEIRGTVRSVHHTFDLSGRNQRIEVDLRD